MASYNKHLSSACGANANIVHLGLCGGNRGISNYLVKYVTKCTDQLTEFLSFTILALDNALRKPSSASDSGTSHRDALFVCEKTMMQLRGETSCYDFL